MLDQDENDDVRNKVLVPVKWRQKHFHIVCDGASDGEQVTLLMHTHLFPKDLPYEEGIHMVEFICKASDVKRVEDGEYRYLCATLVDLDEPLRPKEKKA